MEENTRRWGVLKNQRLIVMFITLVVMPVLMSAEVFDLKKMTAGIFPPDISAMKEGGLSARINGSPIKIESYFTGKSADEVMSFYADEAETKEYELINNKGIRELGSFLINMGMTEPPDKWYYLFYRQSNGEMRMITSGEFGNKTRIVSARISNMETARPENGFDDKIKHCPGFDKFMSIEILSGRNVTGFCNFYRSKETAKAVVVSYYEDYLKKNRWNIEKNYSGADVDMFFIEKNGKSRILSMYPSGDEDWIMVTGTSR